MSQREPNAKAVIRAAMALTDVWSESPHDRGFATVRRRELKDLARKVEPFRHTTLNKLHDPADCEICAEENR